MLINIKGSLALNEHAGNLHSVPVPPLVSNSTALAICNGCQCSINTPNAFGHTGAHGINGPCDLVVVHFQSMHALLFGAVISAYSK